MQDLPDRSLLERRWVTLILIALVFRAVFIGFQVGHLQRPSDNGVLAIETGDTRLYLEPIENLLAGGNYDPDYRMPGVGAPYFLFRLFLDAPDSQDGLVVLQWLLSGISVYLLALLALRLSGSVTIGWVVYVLFLISGYTSWYDSSIASDSLAVSALIFHVHYMQRAVTRRSSALILLSGFFLAWLIFLRPIAVPLLIPAAILVYHYLGSGRRLRTALFLLLPFLIFDSAWTIRNWRVNGTFSPLTNQGFQPTYFTLETRSHAMNFIQGYGGNYIWWAPGSDMRWFGIWSGGAMIDNEGRDADPPPPYAYVPGFTRDSLDRISESIRSLNSGSLSYNDSVAVAMEVQVKLDRYSELYKELAPFNYHVLSRFRMLKNVMWQNGAETIILKPFHELPLPFKLFKILQVLLYVFTYTIGSIALIVLPFYWWRERSLLKWYIPIIVGYMTLVFPLALRMCEWRYMVHQYPFALMLAVYFTMFMLSRTGLSKYFPEAKPLH